MKYRIVEYSDGGFKIQYKFLFFWHLKKYYDLILDYTVSISYDTKEEALQHLTELKREKTKVKKIQIHEV